MKLSRVLRSAYEIPDKYHNTFYLSNASLFQIINYYTCTAYKVIFPELVKKIALKTNASETKATDEAFEYINKLEHCDQFVDLRFPIKREHGCLDIVRGMRAYHGLSLYDGAIGGVRLCEDLKRHDVQGLAILSTYRNACLGIDLAGSHGGLKIYSDSYETNERKDAVQSYIKKIEGNVNTIDIIEPDLFCSPAEMQFMQQATTKSNIVVMGTPASTGLETYHLAGASGAVEILKYFLRVPSVANRISMESSLKGKTFIIYGLGRTGSEIAKLMTKEGAICVGVREYECSMYDTGGINIKALLRHIKKFGSMRNFGTKVKETDSDLIFTELCDIIVLAAVDKAIRCHIADKVQAKVIVEACNGPMFPTSDKILTGRNKLIIPSILAGSGHTLMSYLQYANSISEHVNESKTEDEIKAVYYNVMNDVVQGILDIEEMYKLELDFRKAAYIKAIKKIFDRLLESQIKHQTSEAVSLVE